MEDERSRDSVTRTQRGNGVGRQRPGPKDLARGRGNDDHAVGLHRQLRDRLRARMVGQGEQEVRALQRGELSLVPVDARRGRQTLAARQRDKVVERRCRRVRRADRSHGRNGIVDQPFEKACHVHDVRTQAVEKGLADRLADTASPAVDRVQRRRRRRCREHGDSFLADEIGERVAQWRNRRRERGVEREPDLVRARRGGDRPCQFERMATDTALSARGLARLEVDDDAHRQRAGGARSAACAGAIEVREHARGAR